LLQALDLKTARPAAQQRPFFACPGGQKPPSLLEPISTVAGFTLTDGPSTRALHDASSASMSAAESTLNIDATSSSDSWVHTYEAQNTPSPGFDDVRVITQAQAELEPSVMGDVAPRVSVGTGEPNRSRLAGGPSKPGTSR
jgi:hypothetical protein